MKFGLWPRLLPLLLLVVGCATDNDPSSKVAKNDSAAQTVESGAPVKVRVATIADLDKLIAQQDGKVVVLDLWAMW